MMFNADAIVQAEIDRRLELGGAYQWHAPLREKREWPHLRELFGRRHHTPRRHPVVAG